MLGNTDRRSGVLALPVHVVAPTGADADITRTILTDAAIPFEIHRDLGTLANRVDAACGVVLLTEETLTDHDVAPLIEALGRQEPWSDIPIVLLSSSGSDSRVARWAMTKLGNVAVLERPVRLTTLVSTLHSSLRARARQYQVRDQLVEILRAQDARSHLAAIVESSDDAIVSTSLDGRITSWNEGAARLFGYTSHEAIGQPMTILMPADRLAEEQQILGSLQAGRAVRGLETRRRAKDGRLLDISLTVSPVRAGPGRAIGTSTIARDISVRKQTEARLRQRSERLRLLWTAASVLLTTEQPDAMMRTLFSRIAPHLGLDAFFNYMVTDAGDALQLESCLGIDTGDVQSARLRFGEGISGTSAERRGRVVVANIQQSTEPMVQVAKRAGVRAYACYPLLSEGRLLGTLSFASRQKNRFEPDELEFLETISSYVTVAYERLNLVRRLRDTDRRKDEFLATLAHELRNPLAPIRNALEIMRLTAYDATAVMRARAMMERQLGQMVRLIDDLLDVSRITQGVLELRKERVELSSVVSTAIETVRPLVDAAGHMVKVELPPQPIYLDADPIRLEQVFVNLLNNAAKYTPRGGEIRLTASTGADVVSVAVSDSGIGIPSDQLRSVFEMFTQAGRSPDASQGGLGIGLTLARRLVELHGGQLEAHSDGPGRGSTFTARLPLARGSSAIRAEDAQPTRQPMGCRILVADDNADAAESLSLLLRLLGNEVRTVHDGHQAVEEAATFRPDLLLLDIGMPRLDGYETARTIRRQPWGREMALVALTGWGQDEDKRKAREAGFDRHFTKPVDPAEIEKYVAAFCANQGRRAGT